MKKIGGEHTRLFAVTAEEMQHLDEKVAAGKLHVPSRVYHQGPAGGLVRFHRDTDAEKSKLLIQ